MLARSVIHMLATFIISADHLLYALMTTVISLCSLRLSPSALAGSSLYIGMYGTQALQFCTVLCRWCCFFMSSRHNARYWHQRSSYPATAEVLV
jgi:hypothetical protein